MGVTLAPKDTCSTNVRAQQGDCHTISMIDDDASGSVVGVLKRSCSSTSSSMLASLGHVDSIADGGSGEMTIRIIGNQDEVVLSPRSFPTSVRVDFCPCAASTRSPINTKSQRSHESPAGVVSTSFTWCTRLNVDNTTDILWQNLGSAVHTSSVTASCVM